MLNEYHHEEVFPTSASHFYMIKPSEAHNERCREGMNMILILRQHPEKKTPFGLRNCLNEKLPVMGEEKNSPDFELVDRLLYSPELSPKDSSKAVALVCSSNVWKISAQ